MHKLIKLFFVSLVVTFVSLNTVGYTSHASEAKIITVTEGKDKYGNIILVDEDGNIYTKGAEKEVAKITDKEGNIILVDTYTKSSESESKSTFLGLLVFFGLIVFLMVCMVIILMVG